MRKIRIYIKPILFSLLLITFVFIAYQLLNNRLEEFDDLIYNFIIKIKSDPITVFFRVISFFCSTWFIVISTVSIVIFSKDKKKAFYIALNVILCFSINQLLKIIFSRERPTEINLITEHGFSFPSGHSMMSVAFYGLICYMIYHSNIRKSRRILLMVGLILLISLICISRIYLGVHFASDVVAGVVLSLAYLIFYTTVFYHENKRIN